MKRKSLYEISFDYAPIGISIVSPNGEFLQVNPAVSRMLGYSEEELLGANFRDITYPADVELNEFHLQRLLSGAVPSVQFEKRYIHKQGHPVWVSLQVSLVSDEAGKPQYIAAHIIDITDRKHAEDQMLEARAMYSLIASHSQDIIFYSSENGICHYISPAVEALLGYEPESLIGRPIQHLYHPDEVEWMMSGFQQEFKAVSHRFRHRDGHFVWFETTINSTRGEWDGVKRYIGISRDITERHHAEQALRRSENNLAQAQRIASIGSWEWDAEERSLVWSDEMYRIFGVDPVGFRPSFEQHLLPFIHPDDRDAFRRGWEEALEKGEFQCECRVLPQEGMGKYVRIQGEASLNRVGRPVKLNGTVQDITSHKWITMMLEESVDRYNSLKKYNMDAIVSISLEGIVTSVNPAAERISGYSAEELIGIHYSGLIHEEDLERTNGLFRTAVRSELTASAELRIRHKLGHTVELLVTPAPIYVSKRMIGYYIMAKDITDQKKKDELLRKSEKLSIAGQLAAGIAHEIRNPLTALKGFVQLMAHSSQYADKYLPIMREELERIEMIVSELLMLAKPQDALLREVDLAHLLEDVVTLMGAEAHLQGIELKLVPLSGRIAVRCDANQLKQVFINFIKNAVEAMPDGGTIRIETERDPEQTAIVRLIDQGCGIPEEKLRQIGEPFFTTKETGTGLGMMVSQKIVEHHGGRVEIESEVGVGTTVMVLLPAEPDKTEQAVMAELRG